MNEQDIQVEVETIPRTVFIIPSDNMARFQERLSKLVKRAEKIGVPAPSYTLLKEEPKVIQFRTEERDEDGKPIMGERVVLLSHIELHNQTVVINGFEFVGTLEHAGEDGNVVRTVPGKVIPVQYRTAASWCDHCRMQRRRNDTFIVHHLESNTHKQIGRNCLALYLGVGADRLAAQAELYADVGELAEASEEYGESGGGGAPSYHMLDKYLAYVAEVISRVGWKSRTVAKEYGGRATADIALSEMLKRKYDADKDLFDRPSEKSWESGKVAMEWAENLPDDEVEVSDYLHNIRLISKRGVVGWKQMGFAASIVSSYQKHVGELKRKERQVLRPSEWVGKEGERGVFHLLVEKVISSESMYGTTLIHLMSTDQGDKVVWFGHGESLNNGEWVYLKGTVKKHGERDGVKQTILTRCEQVEMQTYLFTHHIEGKDNATFQVEAVSEKDAKKQLLETLGLKRMPKGMGVCVQQPMVVQVPKVSYESEEVREYTERVFPQHLSDLRSDEDYEARCESEEARRYEERAYGRDS